MNSILVTYDKTDAIGVAIGGADQFMPHGGGKRVNFLFFDGHARLGAASQDLGRRQRLLPRLGLTGKPFFHSGRAECPPSVFLSENPIDDFTKTPAAVSGRRVSDWRRPPRPNTANCAKQPAMTATWKGASTSPRMHWLRAPAPIRIRPGQRSRR